MSRALFISALMCATSAHAETRFLSGVEDVPLAPGLTEVGAGVSFDSVEGRITGAVAAGPASSTAVRSFYMETLPSLGWAFSPAAPGVAGDLVFLRGRERLALTITPQGEGVQLEVRLFTRPASMRGD